MRHAVSAGLAGSLLALCLALCLAIVLLLAERLTSGHPLGSFLRLRPIWLYLGAAIPLVFAGVGGVVGGVRRVAWRHVAEVVDRQFRLKDRAATAWAFSGLASPNEIQRVQIDDAVAHVRRANMVEVAKCDATRAVGWSVVIWTVAMIVGAIPLHREARLAVASESAQQAVDAMRETIFEQLQQDLLSDFRELAELTDTAPPDALSLRKLADDVHQQLQQLQQPGKDQRQTLTTLSKIEAAVAQATRQFDTKATTASLQQLASVLSTAESLQSLAETVEEQDFAAAAEQLEQWDAEALSDVEQQTLIDELKPVAEQLEHEGQDKLSTSAKAVQEGLQHDDDQRVAGGTQVIAEHLQQQALRMKIEQRLEQSLTKLAEAKGQGQNGGNNTAPSDDSRETWGRGKAGKPVGEMPQDQLQANRIREQLTGVRGEGESQREMVDSDRLTGETRRAISPSRRMSSAEVEQVLDHESLPLRHRRTIRRYFRELREVD